MKKTVNESGITLIALVVTIVVLLILAGITITYVLAEGGLFSRAQDAEKQQEMAVIRDYISIAQAELMIEHASPSNPEKSATEIMSSNFPTGEYSGTLLTAVTSADGKFTALASGDAYTVTVVDSGNEYEVTFVDGVATVEKASEDTTT